MQSKMRTLKIRQCLDKKFWEPEPECEFSNAILSALGMSKFTLEQFEELTSLRFELSLEDCPENKIRTPIKRFSEYFVWTDGRALCGLRKGSQGYYNIFARSSRQHLLFDRLFRQPPGE